MIVSHMDDVLIQAFSTFFPPAPPPPQF
uniref:Uncharacterized protein n=1 Tax=Anguilla anguilla TaxID=7936 RepID=A0A0E9UR08_ANGAN